MRQDRCHHLSQHVRRQQPVPVLGEYRGDPDRIVDPEADKPAEQQVVIHLLHQLPLRPDREENLQQACPDQPFRRDRGSAEISVERLKIRIQACQRVIDHLSDLAQRVSRRNALLQINIAEQRPARLIQTPHDHPCHFRDEDESCSQTEPDRVYRRAESSEGTA